jgi:hypothetical protein
MGTGAPTADEVATIASELAQICRTGDLETLICLLNMAALETQMGPVRKQPRAAAKRRAASRALLQLPLSAVAAARAPVERRSAVIIPLRIGGAPRGFRGAPLSKAPAGL